MRIRPQPLIAVRDVASSSRWYQKLLACESAHGGDEYDMLVSDDSEIVLQLHAWAIDEHVNLRDPDSAPHGHGMLLWFETSNFDVAVKAARALKAEIVEPPHDGEASAGPSPGAFRRRPLPQAGEACGTGDRGRRRAWRDR